MTALKYLFATTTLLVSTNLFASELTAHFYGRADLSYDWQQHGTDDSTDNSSRFGVKGKYALRENLDLVFQLEQGIDLAHGGTEIKELLSTRNSYVGLKNDYGMFFFGTHDTPFKKSQIKVDAFNDHAGDIKNFLAGEVRARDSWGYHSPQWDSWSFKVMYVPKDEDFVASKSAAISYSNDHWVFSLGLDDDMRKNDKSASSTKVYDSVRASAQYKFEKWRFGVLVQESERQDVPKSAKQGYLLSVIYSANKWNLMAQHGDSNIFSANVMSTNLGVQYKFLKNVKAYLHYWHFDKASSDETVSLGFEYRL